MMDEVRHIVGDYHCEDDAKQVVDAARTLGHEDHQGDGRPELQERGRGGRGGAAGKEGITRRRMGSCHVAAPRGGAAGKASPGGGGEAVMLQHPEESLEKAGFPNCSDERDLPRRNQYSRCSDEFPLRPIPLGTEVFLLPRCSDGSPSAALKRFRCSDGSLT